MHKPRRERAWRKGTRVRIVAPGWPSHGKLGTVAFDTRAEGALVVALDDGKRGAYATSEAARLRDQGAR